jgi:hypothetical protein
VRGVEIGVVLGWVYDEAYLYSVGRAVALVLKRNNYECILFDDDG